MGLIGVLSVWEKYVMYTTFNLSNQQYSDGQVISEGFLSDDKTKKVINNLCSNKRRLSQWNINQIKEENA